MTVDALREMKTPLIIVAPDPMYDSSSNGYIAGIIDLIFVKLRNYGHYIQPAGNAYDSRPPRLLVTPYNARFAPRGMGITCISNTPGRVGRGQGVTLMSIVGIEALTTRAWLLILPMWVTTDIDEVLLTVFPTSTQIYDVVFTPSSLRPRKDEREFLSEDKRKAAFHAISVTM